MMNSYIKLDAVLNYIPPAIMEEVSTGMLKKYAYQCFRANGIKNWKDHYSYIVTKINHGKAYLPKDINKIAYVAYSYEKPNADSHYNRDIVLDYPNGLDEEDRRVIYYQEGILNNQERLSFFPLKYIGNNTALLEQRCLNLYCQDCSLGFSVDKMLDFIQIDVLEGYLFVIYSGNPVDEFGNLIIPNDENLLQGLAYYAQAQAWLNRASMKEQNAYNMFREMLTLSEREMTKARNKNLFQTFNPNKIKALNFGRFDYDKMGITGNNRN